MLQRFTATFFEARESSGPILLPALRRGWAGAATAWRCFAAAGLLYCPSVLLRRTTWAVMGLGLVAAPLELQAIDPTRTLTQCQQRIWQVPQGLPPSPILCLRQTQSGYLWLGTQDGLVRFDGVGFSPLQGDWATPLEHVWIQDLCEDSEQRLWLATATDGIMRVENHSVMRFGREQGMPSNDVRTLCAGAANIVWGATAAGLVRLDNQADHKLTVFRTSDGLGTDDLRAVCVDGQGTVWAAGDGNQLSNLSGEHFLSRPLSSLAAHGSVRALLAAPNGVLWVGTSDGLIRWADGQERRITTADGLAHDSVLSLSADRNGAIWVGTKDGFSWVREGEIESFHTRDGLSQSTVYDVFEDREGSIWVGTKHGLNQFVDRRTMLYTTREGLPTNEIGPLLEDAQGEVWVGTLGGGLGHFDGRRFSTWTTSDGLADNTIRALAHGADGAMWIGTDGGLNRLLAGGIDKTLTVDAGLPGNKVRCLYFDKQQALWVGTTNGLAVWRDGAFHEPKYSGVSLRVPIEAVIEFRPAEMLVATQDGGLYLCRDMELTRWTSGDLDHRNLGNFYRDPEGLLWLGSTGDGLWLIDDTILPGGQPVFHFTTRDGLYDDDLFGMVADEQDRLWMACSKGIFYVKRGDLLSLARGKLKRLAVTPFSPTDSQRTIECRGGVEPAVCRLQTGQIWFATMRGLIVIDPARLQRALPPAPVVVAEVIVNGKEEWPESVSRLKPGSTNVAFRYAALSFVAPARTTYRYQLVGFDPDWVEAGSRREAYYTNLAPGNYRFRVAARLPDGAWQQTAQDLALTLEPYFYQTHWFAPLCGLAALLAAWGLYRLRVHRIRQRLQLVLTERSRIARELHDTLMQGFSGVTMEMQALSARLGHSPDRETLDEIIRDAGACLREARRSVAGLRNSHGDPTGLSAAIARAAQQLTETHEVRLKLDLAPAIPTLADDVQYNLLRIAQEAVNNAVKHGQPRTITVGLDCSVDQLCLKISDDGIGLSLADGQRPQPGHYGLIGMRERANQIGAKLLVESSPGQGTVVCIRLPLRGDLAAVAPLAGRLAPGT